MNSESITGKIMWHFVNHLQLYNITVRNYTKIFNINLILIIIFTLTVREQ